MKNIRVLFEKENVYKELVYVTTETNQEIQLTYKKEYFESIICEENELIDGKSGTLKYIFPEIGEHIVKIKFKPEITKFQNCFLYCSNLQSIPENLFINNPEVTYFGSCFYDCKHIQSIPENLFANNLKVTSFYNCFYNCFDLQSIPENLFANNLKVITFNGCFYNCSSLQSIPENLFVNNLK